MAKQTQDFVVVVGAKSHPLRDIYHQMMAMRATHLLLAIAVTFLAS